jgi:hypothetical protein
MTVCEQKREMMKKQKSAGPMILQSWFEHHHIKAQWSGDTEDTPKLRLIIVTSPLMGRLALFSCSHNSAISEVVSLC